MVWAYESTSGGNRVVRMTYSNGALGEPQTILDGIPTAAHHNGGRLAFGPDGDLYVGTGDAEVRPRAQDKSSLGGKILRIEPDGSIPSDNPFSGSPVWSYGHRNVQGLAFDSRGQLWATEFGQDTWDELNRIDKGRNYGWPIEEGRGTDKRFRNPYVQWRTDDASPSGLAYLDSSLWAGALRGGRLWQVPLRNGTPQQPRDFFVGEFGRMRTVVVAPDRNLWVTTSNRDGRGSPKPGDDKILEIAPR
jgi:glucose/arabinose dehydrogenase